MTGEESQSGRLRILMTGDAVGGVWQYCLTLASGLANTTPDRLENPSGVDILLAILGPAPSADQLAHAARIPHLTVTHIPYALEWMPQGMADFAQSAAALQELAGEFRPHIVHLNGYSHGAVQFGVPAIVAAHSCVATWWRAVHRMAVPAEWTRYTSAVQAGLQQAAAVIAPTHAMADVVWPIQLAGDQGSAEDGGRLELLGPLAHGDLLKRMREASVFVHPALYEPFGLAVLEAARCRCCLVLADIPSLRELWDGCAQFVDPRDPEQWVLELNRLAGDSEERRELGRRALLRSARYSPGACAARYRELYARVLDEAEQVPSDKGAAA